MPIMNGYEATKQIKSHLKGQATVIIALTATAFEEERAVALSSGCDDFVRKPFREEEIFEKMAHHLGVHYVYEPLVPIPSSNLDVTQPQLNPEMLTVVPTEWREQLYQAAIQLDAELIFQLILQIPPENATLALSLTDLVNHYRFDSDRCVDIEFSTHNSLILRTSDSSFYTFCPNRIAIVVKRSNPYSLVHIISGHFWLLRVI